MFGAAGSLADASRAFETAGQVDALDTRVRAGVADATAAAKRATDTLVASVSDAVATRDAGRSREQKTDATDARRGKDGTAKPSRSRRVVRPRVVGVVFPHGRRVVRGRSGGGRGARHAREARGETRGVPVLRRRPGEARAGRVGGAPRGDGRRPEPAETMRVGPKAVRVVGEIHDFVVADSEESDDTRSSEEDGMDTSSDLETLTASTLSPASAANASAIFSFWSCRRSRRRRPPPCTAS